MKCTLKGASVYENGRFISRDLSFDLSARGADVCFEGLHVFPGFADVHVHFREPGFSYKETIASGSRAAARGGYCAVCTMPNLNPVPDCMENLQPQLDTIARDAAIRVLPYGAITRGESGKELSDMAALAPHVCAFSDDGRGVQDEEMMRAAMLRRNPSERSSPPTARTTRFCAAATSTTAHTPARTAIAASAPRANGGQIARDLKLAKETAAPITSATFRRRRASRSSGGQRRRAWT